MTLITNQTGLTSHSPKASRLPLTQAFPANALSAALLLCGWGLSLTTAYAEEDDVFVLNPFTVEAEADDGYRATAGVHATGFKTPLYQTPLNISILTDDFLTDTQIDNLGEATAYMSGVSADLETHDGPKFTIRGFPANWANRNGVRRYAINGSDNIERFEVLKGPMAVFYGRVAPGGLVNYVTKRASFDEQQKLKLSYGSYDFKRAEIELQGPLYKDKVAYRVNASALDRRDWRDFEYEERWFAYGSLLWMPHKNLTVHAEWEKSDSRGNNANGIPWGNRAWMDDYADPIGNAPDLFAYARENPDNISAYRAVASASTDEEAASLLQTRWRRETANEANSLWRSTVETVRGELPPGRDSLLPDATPYGWRFNVGGPDNFQRFTLEAMGIDVNWTLTDDITLQIAGVADDVWRENIWNVFGDSVQADGLFDPQATQSLLHNDTWNLSGRLLWNFFVLDLDNTIVFHGSRYYDEFRSPRYVVNNDYDGIPREWDAFNDPYFRIGPRFTDELTVSGGENNTRDAIGFTHTIRAFNEKLILLYGFRQEKFKRIIPGGDGTPSRWEATTPMAGVTWEFKEGFTAYASFSESYDLNQGGALISPLSNATQEELNAPLPAKEGEGWDIGIKSAWLNYTLSGSLAIFEVRSSNTTKIDDPARTAADPRNNDDDPGNNVVWSQLVGLDISRGIELDFTWTPNNSYQLQFAFSHLYEAFNADTGDRLPTTPDFELGLWNLYRFQEGKLDGLSIGAGCRYKDRFESRWDGHYIPSYFVVDFLIRYATEINGMPMSFSLNCKNVFDERYIISEPNRVGENRQFRLTTEIEF